MVKGLNLNFKKDSNQSIKPINKFIIYIFRIKYIFLTDLIYNIMQAH